ncbi:MAG TPA: hypothetical protein VGG03_09065 [Thermoanaerobaculia bacterium]|jgi:hypothetical protein
MAEYNLAANPASQSCRLIDFKKAEVRPGIIPDTWFLIVSGEKPCINMEVSLVPLVYVRCPDYWGIEVVGCLPQGICLPAIGEYVVAIPLAGITGSEGIEVIGANRSEKIRVRGGCKPVTASA